MKASNRLTRYDGLLCLSLLGLAVFSWLPDSYFRMVSWPWVLVWQGALLLVLSGGLWRLRRFEQPFYGLGFGFDWLAGGLLICLAVSTVMSSFPLLALQNSLLVVCYLVLIYGLRNSHLNPLRLCQGIVWVGAIAAIISLILWRPTPDMWLSDNFYTALRNRFPLGHHNFTGGYFVLVLPVAAGLTRLHSGWQRWFYGASSLLIAAALYASGSRGAWLGGLVLMVLTLGVNIVRAQGRARLGAILLSGLVLCFAVALLGSNPRVRSLVAVDGWNSPDSSSPGIVSDGPARDRFFMGQAALNIVTHRPLGLGPGNLGRVYERYRPIATGTGLNQVQQVHNTPLQIAAEVGLGGLAVYSGVIICMARLVNQCQTSLSSPQERQLSIAATSGFLGYGVSSLSDYQLENVPIAATLSVLLAALLMLGGSFKAPGLAQLLRRWGSLLLLATAALIVQIWLRSDLSLWMTHQGLVSIDRGELSRANDKFYTAAKLAPWEPTPSALGAQQLEELTKTAADETQSLLQEETLSFYQQSLKAAPNDIWFNQNLAVLARQLGNLPMAQSALARVVQLTPRSQNYSYYLLGLTYQAMGDTEAAIEALALECLINPQVLLLENWQQELSALRAPVFARVLHHYQAILLTLDSNHPLQTNLTNQIATLQWWDASDVRPQPANVQPANIQPANVSRLLLQALFLLEQNPDQAANLLDRCITDGSSPDGSKCRLLKAWLQPGYVPSYLNSAGLDSTEQERVRSHIATYRTPKAWLQSTTQPVFSNQRVALALLYRSHYAQKISSILIPEDLQQFSLPISLNLFSLRWPREFPPLDELVETIRTETLGLPHPTRNNFQLSSPSTFKAS